MKDRIDWQNIIIPRAKELIESYNYRPTLRQIFYQLVSVLLIPNVEGSYKYLSKKLTEAREKEIIDPLALADRKRESSQGDFGWNNPEDFVEDRKRAFADSWQFYTRPLWTSQQFIPVIWLEKGALFPAVTQIADKYRVKVFESIGYSSCTQIYEAIPEFQSNNIVVLQLGDYDPSGEDIARSLKERLEKYGAGQPEFIPLALTKEQTIAYHLPTQMAKKSDPRFKTFIEKHGTDKVVELDALPPEKLEKIIAEKIESYISGKSWNRELQKIKDEKRTTKQLIDHLAKKL